MTSAFANITTAIIAELSASPAVSENIFRARDRQIAEQHIDVINVEFDGAEPNYGAMRGAPVDWRSQYTIECYARTATTSGDLAVDPLLLNCYARLMIDPTLGGIVMDIGAPAIKAEYDSQGQKTGWVRMTFPVLHRTNNFSLE